MRRAALAALFLTACPTPPFEYPPGPPRIVRFQAVPLELVPGEEVAIDWSVERATEVFLADEPVEASGMRTFTPTVATTITLRAEGPGGSTQAELAILIRSDPRVVIESFAVTPARVRPFEPVTLVWRTRGAVQVDLREIGGGPLLEDAPPQGTFTMRLNSSTRFELRADGPGGPLRAEAEVNVSFDPPLIVQLRVTPPLIRGDEQSTLSWTVRDADWIEIKQRFPQGDQLLVEGTQTSGSLELDGAGGSRTIVLAARGPGGETQEEAVLEVIAPAVAEISRFVLTPSTSGAGGDVTAAIRASGADALALFLGSDLIDVIDPNTESTTLRAPDRSTVVSLVAIKDSAFTATRTAALVIDPALPIIDQLEISSTPPEQPGDSFEIHWRTRLADQITIADEGGAVITTSTRADDGRFEHTARATEVLLLIATSTYGSTRRFLPIDLR